MKSSHALTLEMVGIPPALFDHLQVISQVGARGDDRDQLPLIPVIWITCSGYRYLKGRRLMVQSWECPSQFSNKFRGLPLGLTTGGNGSVYVVAS